MKDFIIHKSLRLEFRSEWFNAFNLATWGVPVNTLASPLFGQIYSKGPEERKIEAHGVRSCEKMPGQAKAFHAKAQRRKGREENKAVVLSFAEVADVRL